MKVNLKIATNFLLNNKKQTLSIIAGIGMGIAVQFFLMNLMPSLQDFLTDKTLGSNYHVKIERGDSLTNFKQNGNENLLIGNTERSFNRISDYDKIVKEIDEIPEVKSITSTLTTNGLYNKNGKTRSMSLQGVDIESFDHIYKIGKSIISGSSTLQGNEILVGTRFARDFNLSVNDKVDLALANGVMQSFRIAGIFETGNIGSDSVWILADLKKIQNTLDSKGFVSNIDIQLFDPFAADVVGETLKDRFPYLKVGNWRADNEDLESALKSQTISTAIIQVFITIATAMSISSILGISVLQKSKQLGILKTLGLDNKSSRDIFMYQGLIIGFSSAVVGLVFGLVLIKMYSTFATGSFPIFIYWKLSIGLILVGVIASMVAAMGPAQKSKTLNPIDIIRGN